MKLYVQLMILFVISLIGEGISSFPFAIPGSIIGFDYFIFSLAVQVVANRHVNMVGNFLLANMTILFCLPAVGLWRNLM